MDAKTIMKQLQNSTLEAWTDDQTYSVYRAATPIITPVTPLTTLTSAS